MLQHSRQQRFQYRGSSRLRFRRLAELAAECEMGEAGPAAASASACSPCCGSAWRATVQRRFPLHRLLMRFSYAMTFAAVSLRLQTPIGFALGYESYAAMSPWFAYTAWIPNVIAVAIYSAAVQQRRTQIAPA